MATKFYLAEIPDDFPATNVKFENMTKPLLAIPVNVKGDIGEGQSVTVTSTAPIMKCSGSKNVTASFNGTPKKSWSRMETSGQGTTDNYGLSAVLTPGVWEGTATFSCALA